MIRLMIAALLFTGIAAAQETGPAPAFSRKQVPAGHELVAPDAAVAATRYTLAPPDESDYATLRANNLRQKRMQVGFARELPASLGAVSLDALAWQVLPDGGRVARIEIRSPGASALRASVDARALPKGVEVRGYAPDQLRVAHAPLRAGARAALTDQRGDVFGLELYAPPGVDVRGASLAVASLTHMVLSPLAWNQKDIEDIGASGSCNKDIACLGAEWFEVGKAVAKYVFTDENDDGFLCTGTLLNNLADDGAPLFLTAEHCIENQAYASTMVFYWHFDRTACNGANPDLAWVTANTTTGGADLLAIAAANDMSLMELRQDPAPDTVLAGWNANTPTLDSEVVGIHHPRGDLKKYAAGNITAFTQYSGSTSTAAGSHMRIVWFDATTEGGSSGSALFNDAGQVIGTLEGGGASCTTLTAPDWYGRLDKAYPTFAQWLDPNDTAPPPDEEVTAIADGETVHASLAEGEWHYYSITLTSSSLDRLDAFLTVFEGDADLYVREGQLPTESHYACRSWESGDADEHCTVTDSSTPGEWFIGVFAWAGDVEYALEVELSDNVSQPPPPPPSDSGGGGSGAWLLPIAALVWWRNRRDGWKSRSSSCATPSGRR